MDSKYDIHEYIYVDSSDEDDKYDYIDVDSLDEDDGESDADLESSDPQPRLKSYAIMNEEHIRSHQDEDITAVVDVLSVPRSSAIMLLRHYRWCATAVKSEWFADEGKVRIAIGLIEKKPIDVDQEIRKKPKLTCGICFDNYHQDEMYDAGCGHVFCESCWKGYIGTSVNDGPGCLSLRCPDPDCNAAVCQDMVYKLVSNDDKKKYSDYLLISYIEDNRSMKWCPGPGCGSAIQLVHDTENYDVTCECTFSFCWNCTQEAHHPVECSTVEKWNIKNNSEAGYAAGKQGFLVAARQGFLVLDLSETRLFSGLGLRWVWSFVLTFNGKELVSLPWLL
ncbi:probable E3 ubiquitin-protein ligase ARI8 [Papaver somniferum]|uniref:probable E3 ubiquitin-protein ligase ARI8 n=1 Tax=Papaver somniferum TaxID=3469 RepID=UPI000E6FB5AE|nr:probable E3 ubiquitin-protein ligase ARI8 [Papaver somniferum]